MKDAEKDIRTMLEAEPEDEMEDVIVFTDDEGREHYFYEERQFQVGKTTFAVLVGMPEDVCECGEEDCHCHDHGEESEGAAILAKIEFDADGVPVYVEPDEEEFIAARKVYDALEDEE